MNTNFDYNQFRGGKIATTLMGKKIKYICDTRDDNMLVAEERYRGCGFINAVTYRYHKDGTACNVTPFNRLFF